MRRLLKEREGILLLRREEEFEEGDVNGKCFFLIWKVVVFFVFVGNVYFIIIFF